MKMKKIATHLLFLPIYSLFLLVGNSYAQANLCGTQELKRLKCQDVEFEYKQSNAIIKGVQINDSTKTWIYSITITNNDATNLKQALTNFLGETLSHKEYLEMEKRGELKFTLDASSLECSLDKDECILLQEDFLNKFSEDKKVRVKAEKTGYFVHANPIYTTRESVDGLVANEEVALITIDNAKRVYTGSGSTSKLQSDWNTDEKVSFERILNDAGLCAYGGLTYFGSNAHCYLSFTK